MGDFFDFYWELVGLLVAILGLGIARGMVTRIIRFSWDSEGKFGGKLGLY